MWVVFGYLIFIGIRAIKPRAVYIPRLFIMPVVLSGLKYKVFIADTLSVWVGYFICLFLSSFLSFKYSTMQKIEIIKESMSVKLPGTYWTLMLLIAFFIVKYVFRYICATKPMIYYEVQIFEICVNGLFSGYFLGKAISYLNFYRGLK